VRELFSVLQLNYYLANVIPDVQPVALFRNLFPFSFHLDLA